MPPARVDPLYLARDEHTLLSVRSAPTIQNKNRGRGARGIPEIFFTSGIP